MLVRQNVNESEWKIAYAVGGLVLTRVCYGSNWLIAGNDENWFINSYLVTRDSRDHNLTASKLSIYRAQIHLEDGHTV